jgi:nitronate monooxygenase
MIADCAADDILYTSYFTGVLGNYLRPAIVAQGLDPDHLPARDPSTMNFASGSSRPKSWKDIWGAGQGIGAVRDIVKAADLISRLEAEYRAARARLGVLSAAVE